MTDPDFGALDITRLASGIRARGFVVIALSTHASNNNAEVAIWHVGIEGAFTGAWILSASDIQTDSACARRLLTLAERRALVGWNVEPTLELLKQAAAVAGVDVAGAWSSTSCSISTALVELTNARTCYEHALDHERVKRPNLAPLNWSHDLTQVLPSSVGGLMQIAKIAPTDGTAPALAIAEGRVARWCIERWQETETVRSRREYLVNQFGPPSALPPTWLANVLQAYDRVVEGL